MAKKIADRRPGDSRALQMPMSFFEPESTWTMPSEFPDLRPNRLSIDFESSDPGLDEYGPGFVRKTAKVAGIAVATDAGYAEYFPVGHEHGGNLAKNMVYPWLRDQIRNAKEIVMTNAPYDAEATICGCDIKEILNKRIYDTINAEALIDEEREDGYGLNDMARRYGLPIKDERLLRDAALAHGLGNPKRHMTLLPAKFVAPYAIHDAVLNLLVQDCQRPLLEADKLEDVFEMETKLVNIFLKMRLQGIPIDFARAEQVSRMIIEQKEKPILAELRRITGISCVEPWAPTFLKRAYSDAGVTLPKTAAGNDSVVAKWLEHQTDPLSKLILDYRKANKMRRDFIEKDMFTLAINGLIHPEYHQLKSDEGGTRTGRISMSLPNPQQIPARDEYYGPLIRSLYSCSRFGLTWTCADYSQQEPRLLLHYAVLLKLPGADLAAAEIRANPWVDVHQMITDLVNRITGLNFKRKSIKAINLGIMYSMGILKLAVQLGVAIEEAKKILGQYDGALPFVKALSRKTMDVAAKKGRIRTLLGRVSHFNYWEPMFTREEREDGMRGAAMTREKAEKAYADRGLQRAYTHKALNRLIQGSAADMTKKAIIDLDEAGYTAYIQVHDELDFGLDNDREIREVRDIMQSAVHLEVPYVCDVEVGDPNKSEAGTSNWGHIVKWKEAA